MTPIKLSLIDNDYVTQAKADIDVDLLKSQDIIEFFSRLKEELIIGETEFLSIEGLGREPVNFRISAAD